VAEKMTTIRGYRLRLNKTNLGGRRHLQNGETGNRPLGFWVAEGRCFANLTYLDAVQFEPWDSVPRSARLTGAAAASWQGVDLQARPRSATRACKKVRLHRNVEKGEGV
jgi:hypothetical protein